MEINSSANDRYPPPKNFGLLYRVSCKNIFIIMFITFVWQINSAPQPNGGLNFADDPDIIKTYKNAIAEKREASNHFLKIEAKLELVKQKIQSSNDEELLTIKEINLLTTALAKTDIRSTRKRAKKNVLNAEKKLRNVIDKERIHKERLMNVNDQMEKAKKRLETAREEIEKIESYIEAI